MKIKLFLLTLILTALLYAAASYFFVNYTKGNLVESAKNAVSQSITLYSRIAEADKFDKIHKVESLAKNPKLIEAVNPAKWAEVSEEVLASFEQDALEQDGKSKGEKRNELSPNAKAFVDKIETEMNVINQIYDDSDTIFVTDTKGNIIAKNLDGIFRGVNIADNKLFQIVRRGTANRDIMKIKGKTYLVSAAPIFENGDIIGMYFSADNIDSEAAKNAVANLYDESIFGNQQSKFYFGFFDKSSLLGSTLPTQLHESFKKFIKGNQDVISRIDEENSKRHDMEIVLNGETFFASISRHPSLSENEDLFYISLISKNKLLEPLNSKLGTFTIVTILFLIISLVLLYIFDEQNGRPVNKFMEGMLEIINGNIKFRFNNDAKGVEGNLNQNANMMIATILGERMPDKEKTNLTKK